MRTTFSTTVRALALLACLSSPFALAALAQTIDVSVADATAARTKDNPDHWQISVTFNDGFDIPQNLADADNPAKSPAADTRNYRVLDIDTGERLQVIYAYFDTSRFYTSGVFNNSGHPNNVVVFLDPSVRLEATHRYHLYVLNVTFQGKPTSNPPPQNFVKVPEESSAAAAGGGAAAGVEEQGDPAKKDSLSFTAADGREDSNIYLSGEVNGARDEGFTGSADIKVQIPVRKIIGDRVHSFDPFFELKAASGPKRDPDTLSTGLRWEWPVWRYRGDNIKRVFRRVIWRNAPMIEAERDFDNTNFIWESRFRFMSRSYLTKHTTFYFRPFVGQELGANIKSPVPEGNHKLIYRPFGGLTLNLIFPLNRAGLQDVSFEGSYIRRWLLRREVGFEENDDGSVQSVALGKGPRDYLDTKFNVNFSKSFGASVTYEYGRLPPSFKLVDHKVSVGLTYKIKIDR